MKIIIVGNSSCLLKTENGSLIDSFDRVVRLNKFQIKGYEQYVGKKLDIYCSKWLNMNYNLDTICNYKKIWLPYPKPPYWWLAKGNFKEVSLEKHNNYIKKYNLNLNNIIFLSENKAKEIESIFKNISQPSTGLISLMLATQEYENEEIYYTGFDNFSSGWYWKPEHNCIQNMQNSILFEKIFINYMEKTYDLKKL